MKKVLKNSVFALILALSFAVGAVIAPTAQGASYNRTAAANYAKKYACNQNESCRNSAYPSYGSDCTNFVSQALKAGGKANVQSGSKIWYYLTKSTHSKSWSTVAGFRQFWQESGKGRSTATDYTSKMGNAYTNAALGDVYVYDWGTGDGWSHLAIASAYGAFPAYKDTKTNRYYTSVTSGKGDHIAQHSTDRDGAPWNWGYHTEKNSAVKSKMRTMILHISN